MTLTTLVACAAGPHAHVKPTSRSPGGGSSGASGFKAGVPQWVTRGHVAVVSGSRRVFYGVGAASGVRNPALLRGTADNRARNELSKVFHVFSASLMKDYADSAGTQHVEQMIATLNAMALEGTDIVDRYVAGDGTMYALAALDLQSVQESIHRAKELGAVKTHTAELSLEDIFDARADKRSSTRESAPAAVATPAPRVTATGEAPAWVSGQDARFPARAFLCAVGQGTDRAVAENGAYAALSRIFVAQVTSVSQDFMGAYASTGAARVEVQSSESLTEVSTQKLLTGVNIVEVWTSRGGEIFAYGCIERQKAAQALREQIGNADADAGHHLKQSAHLDRTSRVRILAKALNAIVQREALNGELRIVDPDGIGMPGPFSHADVAAAFDAAVLALRVGVQADGPYADDLRSALVDGLTDKGFEVSDLVGDPGDAYDMLVSATVRVEDAGPGKGRAARFRFARGVVSVSVKNVATRKILTSFVESRKEGSRTLVEAERMAVRKLAKKVTNKIGARIDETMTGG